ncbi:hypothetical protein K435DRAFT_959757 [Dendrothele bispora CBS 962.96]|uniref:Small ribosomal subunit protein mS35 mitochondrial conserved domain-containing protein n=1 Tax=Dendrothele bispora (strain CBS 962.96) TaxID=1314807 RepID=A0A4S8MX54_DENBC|nr:hypothetical protein K435DRAFT_959757 [Dendrothele bispora CBS 962.96]
MAFRAATHLVRAAHHSSRSNALVYTSLLTPRLFHSTPSVAKRQKLEDPVTADEALDLLDDPFDDDDTASAGHLMLREHRQTLYYMRLIEHEMPKLVAYRKPFKPPTNPLVVRSLEYGGVNHPVLKKRVVVVAVDDLPLHNDAAIHKLKLLAGPRWTPRPPADSGINELSSWKHGYVKISCEDFPQPMQNLKWVSDTLDRLVKEANNSSDTFKDVPLDVRHLYSKARKAKKGEHLRTRIYDRPTIRDFPQEWLPDPPVQA